MSADNSAKGIRGYFERFVHSEVSGSIVLLACTLTALVWANSPWKETYEQLLHTGIGLSWGGHSFSLSLHHWINDGLMVVFFFVVGLEIKRELLVGHLSSFRKAALPVAAALGGMVVPAGLYTILNVSGEGVHGWGIPMATDIAFALGVLAVLGSRVPIGLKVFLTALAIADDLGAVLVIALFYTDQIHLGALIVAAAFLALLVLMVRFRVRRVGLLMAVILGVWVGVFVSGIHATVAGILVAFAVPVTGRIDPGEFFRVSEASLTRLRESGLSRESMLDDESQMNSLLEIGDAVRKMTPRGLSMEHYLHPAVAFFVLPLFALFNAGVSLGGEELISALSDPVAIGVVLGLLLGKPIGIFLSSWLTIRLSLGALPDGVNWGKIAGAGFLAGIGFTMSLFVTELAFSDPHLISSAKLGILFGSVLSAILGYTLVRVSLRK